MKLLKLLAVTILTAVSIASVEATTVGTPPAANGFYTTSTNIPGTTGAAPAAYSYAFVSSRSGNGGAAAVNYIGGGTASNAPYVFFWKVASQAPVVYTNSTVALYVGNTNGFASATETMVIEHRSTIPYTYEKRVGSSITNNNLTAALTNSLAVVVDAAPNTATIPGDVVYLMKVGGQAPWWNLAAPAGTNALNSGSGYFYVGQPGLPIMVELGGATASAFISGVSGVYLPPPVTSQIGRSSP